MKIVRTINKGNSRSLAKGRLVMTALLLVAGMLCLLAAPAGVAAQGFANTGHTYEIGAGYASAGGPTDNGTLLTMAKQFSPRVWGTAKTWMLASPANVTIATLGPRYRFPLSALHKPDEYFDSAKWFPFVDFEMGVVKDPLATKFVYGAGMGLDYQVSPTLTVMVLEADYLRSKFFPNGGILVSNVHTVTTGLKIHF